MAETELGRLQSVRVKGLIGRKSIEIKLNRDEPTVLTGRNGSGKSTILRAIHGVATGAWHELLGLPLEELGLQFAAGDDFTVKWAGERLHLIHDEGKAVFPPEQIDLESRVRYVGGDMARWRLQMSHDLSVSAHGEPAWLEIVDDVYNVESPWLRIFMDAFEVLFITDQRLVIQDEESPRPSRKKLSSRQAVGDITRRMARQVATALSDYARYSQRREADFLNVMIRDMVGERQVDEEDVQERLNKLSEYRTSLRSVGLLTKDDLVDPILRRTAEQSGWMTDPRIRLVISVQAEEALARMQSLEGLRSRLAVFLNFLNEHYVEKEVIIAEDGELVVASEDDSTLRPTDLSSGEQQLMVLAYEVLFQASPGTLVLIDEPELSLHVLWQDSLLDDLAAMSRVNEVEFLLATHSPTLLGARSDLQVSLDV